MVVVGTYELKETRARRDLPERWNYEIPFLMRFRIFICGGRLLDERIRCMHHTIFNTMANSVRVGESILLNRSLNYYVSR